MTAIAVGTMQGLSKWVHSNSFPWYPLISQKLCKWRDQLVQRCNWSVAKMKCAISINTIGVALVTKGVAFVTKPAFGFYAERPVRKIRDTLEM